MQRDQYDADHNEAFRASVRAFIDREVVPHQLRWEQERNVDCQTWIVAGKQNLIGLLIPEPRRSAQALGCRRTS